MRLTKELEERLSEVPLYATDAMPVREVLAVIFHEFTPWTWYVVEAEKQDDDWLLFTWCKSGFGPVYDEWGYVTINQLIELPDISFYIPSGMQIKSNGEVLE